MPSRREVTPDQELLLTAAGSAASHRREAESRYLDAVLAAHDAGISNAEIARSVGISDEGVRKLITRNKPRD